MSLIDAVSGCGYHLCLCHTVTEADGSLVVGCKQHLTNVGLTTQTERFYFLISAGCIKCVHLYCTKIIFYLTTVYSQFL